eukprot:1160307-Pelagomonas_calceolata.AAC.8
MPVPDEIELPDATALHPAVCHYIQKLNPRTSPGFSAGAAPFIKHAEKRVPAVNGRGTERFNVLAPYVARLFAAMMEKAENPTCWKAAKLTPLHKKGSLLDPANFCMLAMAISESADNVQGAVTGASDVRVTHVLYADDLCLTANDPTELQIMLDRLHGYAQRKGLTINVVKSELVHFHSKGNNVPIFLLGGAQLVRAESSKRRDRSAWPIEDQAERDGHPNKLAQYHNWVALPFRHNAAFGKPLHVPRVHAHKSRALFGKGIHLRLSVICLAQLSYKVKNMLPSAAEAAPALATSCPFYFSQARSEFCKARQYAGYDHGDEACSNRAFADKEDTFKEDYATILWRLAIIFDMVECLHPKECEAHCQDPH